MKSNLKELYQIQKVLENCGYHDISRISREILEFCKEKDISPTSVLKRIQEHEPWEYIRGESEFHGLKFKIDRNTLIPRPETEQLVDIAKSLLEEEDDYKYVLDVGTGSGCIIIFLAKVLCKQKQIKFIATDVNSKSLEIAKENSVLHKVNEKVSFLQSNLLEDVRIDGPSLIIANLPYVPAKMYEDLEKSVKDYEPREAIVGGRDGLRYYRELLEQIQEKGLSKYKTTLLIEIEPTTLDDLRKLLREYEISSSNIKVFKDFRDKERFVLLYLS